MNYYYLDENGYIIGSWSGNTSPPPGTVKIPNVPFNYEGYKFIDGVLEYDPLPVPNEPNWSLLYTRSLNPLDSAAFNLFQTIGNASNQVPFIRLGLNLNAAMAGNSNIAAFNSCVALCLSLDEMQDQAHRFSIFRLMKECFIPISFNLLNQEELENEDTNYVVFPLEVRNNALSIIENKPAPYGYLAASMVPISPTTNLENLVAEGIISFP